MRSQRGWVAGWNTGVRVAPAAAPSGRLHTVTTPDAFTDQ